MRAENTAIILASWLSASSSACHGLLIITDNAITYKAQRQNARELEVGERGNY